LALGLLYFFLEHLPILPEPCFQGTDRRSGEQFVTPPASSEGKRTAVETGDVLVSITADLGIIGVIPNGFGTGYVNQHIALARIGREAANARYVGWYLSSRGGQRQFEALNESGAKAGLNLPTIRKLQVPIPSDPIRGREEQDRIAAKCRTRRDTCSMPFLCGASFRPIIGVMIPRSHELVALAMQHRSETAYQKFAAAPLASE
jgi:hypothetical protein